MPSEDLVTHAVQSLAKQSKAESIEDFALELADSLLSCHAHVKSVEIFIASHLWKRLTIEGQPCTTAFMKGSDERQTARVTRARQGAPAVISGFEEMTVLTTAPAATDELSIFAIAAEWPYPPRAIAAGVRFNEVRQGLREGLIAIFAQGGSSETKAALDAMASDALQHNKTIDEISIRMTSRPLFPSDPDKLRNDSDDAGLSRIYVPTDEPQRAFATTARRVHDATEAHA